MSSSVAPNLDARFQREGKQTQAACRRHTSERTGQKRFALEGGETALAILEEILERAALGNVHELVVGMAHRGRLNILANTVGKDMKQIFSEFEGDIDPGSTQGSGDVKYHLGATGVRKTSS